MQVPGELSKQRKDLIEQMLLEVGLRSRDLGDIEKERHFRESLTLVWCVIFNL